MPSILFLWFINFIMFSRLLPFTFMMTASQAFYFKLMNAFLDVAAGLVNGYNQCRRIDYSSKSKSKFNPVSAYDKIIEINIRDALVLLAPSVNVYGEECGFDYTGSDNTWFIDPIDGTKSFIRGSSVWGTILGLAKRNNVVMGAVGHPMMNERLVAVGGNSYYGGGGGGFKRLPLQSQDDKPLSKCVVATSSIDLMSVRERAKFVKLVEATQHTIYYYDCYAYTLLSKGYIDIIVECHFKPYDFVGLVPILKATGCCVCDWQGNDVCYSDRVLVVRNSKIKASVLPFVNDT
ncbi:Histidinol phosphatase [Candidatus Hodgkinia cicadicola]|nr:Histidinol phosphatase [Candidatus Hodgkinia cicadicola]